MTAVFGTPPPLGTDFEKQARRRIAAHRLRRRVLASGAAVVLIAAAGGAFAVVSSGGGGHPSVIRSASTPKTPVNGGDDFPGSIVPPTSTVPTASSSVPATTSPTVPVHQPPSTSAQPVPPVTVPPTGAPTTLASSCPSGNVSATVAVDALQKGTNTWFVWATATVTNNSNAVVDVLVNVWVRGAADPAQENSDIGLDTVSEAQSLPIGQNAPIPYPAPDAVAIPVGQSATIALRGFHPLAADGSNAVASVKPTAVSGGGILRRWDDLTQRNSCAAPGESVDFPLVSTTPGGLVGWPGM